MHLTDIIETLQWADDETRLEVLLDYAERLPPLPEAYQTMRDAGLHQVHECQSPVFLVIDLEDDQVRLYGDVPREAPTARSFVALMHEAFDGASPDDVAEAPDNILHTLGLAQLLGMRRTQGLSAIYHRIKSESARLAAET